MAVNNNGNLLDTAGEVAIDFVWGNMPMQPNDARPNTAAGRLDPALDNHITALSGWNGYPQYNPNTTGEDVAGATDYVLVPNVLRTTTASATDALKDASLVVTVASAGTVQISRSYRAGGGGYSEITTSEPHGFIAGDVVVIAGTNGNPDLEGTWTITNVPSPTKFRYQTVTSGTITEADDTGTAKVAALAGKIWKQSLAAGQNSVVPGAAVTITPYAA